MQAENRIHFSSSRYSGRAFAGRQLKTYEGIELPYAVK
jgi:hypothetical protein